MKNTKRIMETMKIRVSRLDENALLPRVNHEGDAGMDFYSLEDYIIKPHWYQIVKTGIKVNIPNGFVGLLWPKSKNNHLLGAGVVDYTYGGEILFKVVNYFDHELVIRHYDPIGQMIVVVNLPPEIVEEEFELNTARGSTGGIVEQLVTIEELTYPEVFNRKTWD